MLRNQKGFTGFGIVLIALTFIAIAAAGYFVYQARQDKPQDTTAYEPTKATSHDKAKTYFQVDSWKIRLELSDKLKGLMVGSVSQSSYSSNDESVAILAPALDESWTCSPVNNVKATIGSISRTSAEPREGPYAPLATKKLGQYTYGFEAQETSNCTKNPMYKELVAEFKAQFANLSDY